MVQIACHSSKPVRLAAVRRQWPELHRIDSRLRHCVGTTSPPNPDSPTFAIIVHAGASGWSWVSRHFAQECLDWTTDLSHATGLFQTGGPWCGSERPCAGNGKHRAVDGRLCWNLGCVLGKIPLLACCYQEARGLADAWIEPQLHECYLAETARPTRRIQASSPSSIGPSFRASSACAIWPSLAGPVMQTSTSDRVRTKR